ncbi:MAG TPA: SusD/RagB family nutrient-binding outer membrane lipoprotein [Bacteroidales bacterium]|nr:SusD/RagB family nutrient-binding outer membrane lipoprotein [Bacteroidales bacterium]
MKSKFPPAAFLIVFSLFFMGAFTSCLNLDEEEPPPSVEMIEEDFQRLSSNIVQWRSLDFTRFQLIWMQQIAGVRSFPGDVDKYILLPAHLDESWGAFYVYILTPLVENTGIAMQIGARKHAGVMNILQAYALGLMIDTWGDIPYWQTIAFGGFHQFPQYDAQQELLEEVFRLLDLGIANLRHAESPEISAAGDPFFGGDSDRWIRAANALRLRYLLREAHQSQSYTGVAYQIPGLHLMRNNGDDLLFSFTDGSNPPNPYYDYETRIRHTRVGAHFANMLHATNDPRLPRLIAFNLQNQRIGSAPGQSDFNASSIGPALASANSPVVLISFAEQKFIEAELYLRNNQQALADAAFREAVVASLTFFGASNPDWEALNANRTHVTLQQIIEAKYIALFLQPEVWSDFRRTGFPQLSPYLPGGEIIPRRMLYPQDELTNNPDRVPQNVTIFSRVWWDRE